MIRHTFVAAVAGLVVVSFLAEGAEKKPAKLPRVLLIGDSISIGYTVAVRSLLKGKANVHRIPENGGPHGISFLKE